MYYSLPYNIGPHAPVVLSLGDIERISVYTGMAVYNTQGIRIGALCKRKRITASGEIWDEDCSFYASGYSHVVVNMEDSGTQEYLQEIYQIYQKPVVKEKPEPITSEGYKVTFYKGL